MPEMLKENPFLRIVLMDISLKNDKVEHVRLYYFLNDIFIRHFS